MMINDNGSAGVLYNYSAVRRCMTMMKADYDADGDYDDGDYDDGDYDDGDCANS